MELYEMHAEQRRSFRSVGSAAPGSGNMSSRGNRHSKVELLDEGPLLWRAPLGAPFVDASTEPFTSLGLR